MMPLRKIVAGPKIRTVENGFDLDLTYVTERVVAMAFPAEGFEKLYRNSIDDVSQFIKQKHDGKFMIFNLSGRKYNYQKFNGKVKDYDWQDHQAPALYTIFQICQQMLSYLEQNQENVVVVHCNHGKGRTGTIIVCLLLFCNFFDDVVEALNFYSKRRFEKQGYGVTQPCQVRYIHYFHNLLINKNVKIKTYALKRIEFKGRIFPEQAHIIVSKARNRKVILKTDPFRNGILDIKDKKLLLGDVFFDFRVPGVLGIGDKNFARLNLNTIFIPESQIVSLGVQGISPDNLLSKFKGVIDKDFKIEIFFSDYCDCNMTEQNGPTNCPCFQQLQSQKMYWEKMYLILSSYKQPTKRQGAALLFGTHTHDCKEQREQYKIERSNKS